jgi:putative phosphoesterase
LPPHTLHDVVIAVISDTHLPRGSRRLPDACVARIRSSDLVIHAGDIATRGVLDQIRAIGPPVEAVQGNVDSAELQMSLPESRVINAEGARIAILHDAGPASGRLRRLERRFPQADAVVFGHSHVPLHERTESFQIFNPGSPTERRRQPRHTMGVATVDGGAIEFELVELD